MTDDVRHQIAAALDGFVLWGGRIVPDYWATQIADALLPVVARHATEQTAEAWDDGYRAAERDALNRPYSDRPEAATWRPTSNPHRADSPTGWAS